MKNVSRNSMDLINSAALKLKGKYGKGFLATLIAVAPLMLCVFSLYLVPVAMLLWGVLNTGYMRYIRDLMDDKNPSLKVLFSEFTNPGLEMFLGVILVGAFSLGGVLFIAPGIILIAMYSMSLFFADKNRASTPIEAMRTCRENMKGHHTDMLSFKLLFWLAYVILIVLGLAGVIIATQSFVEFPTASVIVYALNIIFTTVVWSVVTVYYQATCEMYFRELLAYNEEKLPVKEAEIVVEPVAEEVVENKTEKSEKKPTVRKTSAKTTTTRKTSTSTTKAKTTPAKTSKTTAPAKKTTTKSGTTKASTGKSTSTKTGATKTTTKKTTSK